MDFSLNICQWSAISSGLYTSDSWQSWAQHERHDWSLPLPKNSTIPMMMARRMSVGSRLAVEVALSLLHQKPNAAVFISRHGELERTYKILTALNQQQPVSPTDFAMSVHNTAAGLFTILAKSTIPIASIAAGDDGFQQGLLEVQAMFASGLTQILLIDFEGVIPDFYHPEVNNIVPAYAVGFIITPGSEYRCHAIDKAELSNIAPNHVALPQSLSFLKNSLQQQTQFILTGTRQDWLWQTSGV